FDQLDDQIFGGQRTPTGVDALAWYSSFHNLQPEWGIYIPTLSLMYIERRWLKEVRAPFWRKFQIAAAILHQHELFHFATDYMVAQWEVLLSAPMWALTMEQRRDKGIYLAEEEKLANAHMLRQLGPKLSQLEHDAVLQATRRQPPGYSDGV